MRGFLIFGLGIALGACSAYVWLTPSGPSNAEGIPPSVRSPISSPESRLTVHSSDAGHGSVAMSSGLRRSVRALGTIEPRGGIVAVASHLIGYQIREVNIREGDLVAAGDLLFQLDATQPEAELELAQTQLTEATERQQGELRLADQRLRAAELAYQQALDGGELELEAQRARVEAVVSRHDQARRDLVRLEELRRVRESLASEQQVEQQRVVAESAAAELRAAKLSLQGLEQSLAFQRKTAEAELEGAKTARDLARQTTGLDALRQRIELARVRLTHTDVRAPMAGTILSVATRPGELVSQQPLCQLADLRTLVCLAEIDAGDVPLLGESHPATVIFPGWQDREVTGHLERIGSAVVESRLRPLDPRRPIDRHIARGVVALDLDGMEEDRAEGNRVTHSAMAWVGLQVEVAFRLKEKSAPNSGP